MKKLYILHEYNTPAHFQALYKAGPENGYKIEEFIVISKKYLFQTFIHELHHSKKPFSVIASYLKKFVRTWTVKKLEGQILLVGIAPYNTLMNRYEKLFRKNFCIYFTSWDTWDGSKFPKGCLKNRENYERILKEDFKGIACVTKSVQEAVSFLGLPTKVVYHSISTQKYKPDGEKDIHSPLKFVYVGQFIERKGIDFIIRFAKENPDVNFSLDMLGGGALEADVNQLCRKDHRIHNLGFQPKDYIQTILRNYDFMILPTRAEPFGIVIIESMAAGTPVLVSDVTGPKEIITDNEDGFFFMNGNYKDFEEKLKKLFAIDNEKYLKLQKNAILSAKKYDESELVKKWIELF